MRNVFERTFDIPIDEKSEILLLRFPGLTSSNAEESAREFIDDDFVDACRAGDVVRFTLNPFDQSLCELTSAESQIDNLGVSLAAYSLNELGATAKQICASLTAASKIEGSACLCMDIIQVMQQLGHSFHGDPIYIKDGFFDGFSIYSQHYLGNINFQESYFQDIEIQIDCSSEFSPKFLKCHIDEMHGPTSRDDIKMEYLMNRHL